VTVLETRVHRSSARNARLASIVVGIAVGLLTATVAADHHHPIIALAMGIALGGACGAVAWVLVRVWPVLRLLWWWSVEITAALSLVSGWMLLARHTTLVVRLVLVALLVAPFGASMVRRHVVAWVWVIVVRHRLRTCFAQFIITNQSGTLPLILWARPTPVGERVWIYLRPGLSMADLEGRTDKIAVTCHASAVVLERASDGNAAYLRIDVKRREVLSGTVCSPLVDVVDPATPAAERVTGAAPTALDLPDVVADAPTVKVTPAKAVRTATNGKTPAAATASAPVTAPDGDDISDWI